MIAIIESYNETGWGYCPMHAMSRLGDHIRYSDEEQYPTYEAAVEAFKLADPALAKTAQFRPFGINHANPT
jgi:hypothetical protein